MTRFMLFYPLLFGLLGRYVLPWADGVSNFNIDVYADLFVVILGLFTPQIYGAITGFSILDDRDDSILTSIKVTPLSIHQFLSFRLAMVLFFSFISTAFVIWFSNIGNLPAGNILAISFLASFAAPVTGFIINSLAGNKIEGFAIMKASGIIMFLPVAALFFTDVKELIFCIAPGYWPAKAISSIIRGSGKLFMTYDQYYFIGLAYVVFLNIVLYRIFFKKIEV